MISTACAVVSARINLKKSADIENPVIVKITGFSAGFIMRIPKNTLIFSLSRKYADALYI